MGEGSGTSEEGELLVFNQRFWYPGRVGLLITNVPASFGG